MLATLYVPGKLPLVVPVEGLQLPGPTSKFAHVTEQVAEFLGCAKPLVDVMDSSPTHVAYTIFDYEGDDVNLPATEALSQLSQHPFDLKNESHLLHGPVLIVVNC